MSLKQRLSHLERQAKECLVCPLCGGNRTPEIIVIPHDKCGEKAPPPKLCPACGVERKRIFIIHYGGASGPRKV